MNNYAIINISDIHYRKDAEEGAHSIINSFLEDIEKEISKHEDHEFFLTITGDIVQAGTDTKSYTKFIEHFDEKLTSLGLDKKHRIIVPGNHDIDRQLIESNKEDFEKIISIAEDEEKFNNLMENDNILNKKFENYEVFEQVFSDFALTESISGSGWKINDELGIYCLNSALCSFAGVDEIEDHRTLSVDTRKLHEWCNRKTTRTNILFMHHPLDHLTDWSEKELEQLIDKHFVLCLSGHNHMPDIYHNRIPESPLICSAPPLFCGKKEILAYSVVFIKEGEAEQISYRQYIDGTFFPSSKLAKHESGIVPFGNLYLHHLKEMDNALQNALESFKGQPSIFVEPKLSETREFNEDPNLLRPLIESPYNAIIIAHPQFGLTCSSLYMRLQAFKEKNFWIYCDAKHAKARNVIRNIEAELLHFKKNESDIKCLMIDAWDAYNIDHVNIYKNIKAEYPEIPIIVFATYSGYRAPEFNLSLLDNSFKIIHLQALNRAKMREFVNSYIAEKKIGKEEEVLTTLASHIDTINIHRTPFNCLTLLKAFEGNHIESLINKTKLLKEILRILFIGPEAFYYTNEKPDVEDCCIVLGEYCKKLIMRQSLFFDSKEFIEELKSISQKELIPVKVVDVIVHVLLENHILTKYNNFFEFKHKYWVFYFAAEHMFQDEEFKSYIFDEQNYVNFPEIVEFYSGIDGRRDDAMSILLSDLQYLIDKVDENIGIEGPYNPLSDFLWNPSKKFIEGVRKEIAEKVESSNLPSVIKDQHADKSYDSETPYDQSINKFLNEYAVISLLQSIKATSRALRNSTRIKANLKIESIKSILRGWEEISKVMFWLADPLAKEGKAAHDGFSLILASNFAEDFDERYQQILLSNPKNTIKLVKDDLASKKIGELLYEHFNKSISEIQRHLLALFLIHERPIEWEKAVSEHLNLLHPNSYYFWNLLSHLKDEIEMGFLREDEEKKLKMLVSLIVAKSELSGKPTKRIPRSMLFSEDNKVPIDKILAKQKPKISKGFLREKHKKQ